MIRTIVDPGLIPTVFSLDREGAVEESAFLVLTSAGRGVARAEDGSLSWTASGEAGGGSLAERWAGRLALVPDLASADCVGIGARPGRPPVVLSLRVRDGVADADALFEREPDRTHYDLLSAVGVRYLSGEPAGACWRARFRNELPRHLLAAALSGFSRTGHCNDFFLDHGQIDERLAAGLVVAAAGRIRDAHAHTLTIVLRLAVAARRQSLPMTCVPASPDVPLPFGNVVPLGFLLAAAEGDRTGGEKAQAVAILLRRHLDGLRCEGLWPFHRGHLPTATDSALVLIGHRGVAEIEALERFNDGSGFYLPQLTASARDGLHMAATSETEHWCQGDLGTTSLVRALRAGAGLAPRTPLARLARTFDARGSLFFANPYLMDWALALALEHDPEGEALRDRLRREILASANADGSFGAFDQALSTALAILALRALGVRHRPVLRAQVRLAELVGAHGCGVASTPFYSTRRLTESAAGLIRGRGILRVGEEWHALSLYEDTHRMVVSALASQALDVPATAEEGAAADASAASPHPRYRAASAEAYVAGFALPPYIKDRR